MRSMLIIGLFFSISTAREIFFKIDKLPYDKIPEIQKGNVEIWEWNPEFALGVCEESKIPEGYDIEILDKNPADKNYFIVKLLEDVDLSIYKKYADVLWKKGNLLLVRGKGGRPYDLKIRAEIKYIRKRPIKFSLIKTPFPLLKYTNPLIEEMISNIDSASVYNYLLRLQNFVTRNSHHDSIARAAEYVFNQFLTSGLDLVYYSYAGEDPWGSFPTNNVVGIKYGETDSALIICAHLDATAGNPYGVEEVAPGADDNGSGSAGVLTAAKVMSPYNFHHEIRFICFIGEEQGLIGSGTYADSCANAGSKIIGVYNMDMICHNDQGGIEDLDADDNQHSPSTFLADTLIYFGNQYVSELPIIKKNLGGGASSDHASFQQVGYPAILTIDGASLYANPYIHSPEDTIGPSANDFTLMKNGVKAIVATVAELAGITGVKVKEVEKFERISLNLPTIISKPLNDKGFIIYSFSGRKVENTRRTGIYFLNLKATPEIKKKIIYLK